MGRPARLARRLVPAELADECADAGERAQVGLEAVELEKRRLDNRDLLDLRERDTSFLARLEREDDGPGDALCGGHLGLRSSISFTTSRQSAARASC
jgi:hypothetical protein